MAGLGGIVEILIEMKWYGQADDHDRRRRLCAFSRHAATPRRLVVEFDAAGTDYLALTDLEEGELGHGAGKSLVAL